MTEHKSRMRRSLALLGFVTLICRASSQQEVECGTKTKADIVFIMDGSGSIGGQNFLTQVDFIKYIVNQFPVGPDDVQFGLLQFATSTKVEFLLNTFTNKADILNNLNTMRYAGGGTKIGLALTEAKAKMFTAAAGRRKGVPTVAVVITDGRSTDSVVQPAYQLRADYIQVFSIGIGTQANVPELEEIANKPSWRHAFTVTNFNGLQLIQAALAKVYCKITTQAPTFTPEETRPTDLTFTDVPTTRPMTSPTRPTGPTRPPTGPTRPPTGPTRPPTGPTRPPTGPTRPPTGPTRPPTGPTRPPTGPTRPPTRPSFPTDAGKTTMPVFPTDAGRTTELPKVDCADDKVDIAFALDSSGSISLADWNILKTFVVQMVQGFNLGRDKTRVAALKFSDYVTDQFQLRESFLINALNEIKLMQYDGAGTKTHLAIRHLRQVSFTAANGARQDASKVAIIITDGNSNEPHTTEKEADLLKKQGVLVFVIGVGNKVTPAELRRMASDPKSDFVFTVSNYKDLINIQARLNTKTCGKVKEFTRPQYTGPTTPAPYCVDKSTDCGSLGGLDFCTDFEPWAKLNCNATCKFCAQATTPTPGPCYDTIDDCDAYGASICTDPKFREFAKTRCSCSCKFCACAPKTTKAPQQTIPVCQNLEDNCAQYGKETCTNPLYKTWISRNCEQYCGLCSGGATTQGPACVDTSPDCADYGQSVCSDAAYAPWVQLNCLKFCNKC